jgi:hypothetical protein
MATETLYGEQHGSLHRPDTPDFGSRFFIIAIVSSFSIGIQNFFFASSAVRLTSKLRALSFRAILRQDSKFILFHPLHHHSPLSIVEFFDKDENSVSDSIPHHKISLLTPVL